MAVFVCMYRLLPWLSVSTASSSLSRSGSWHFARLIYYSSFRPPQHPMAAALREILSQSLSTRRFFVSSQQWRHFVTFMKRERNWRRCQFLKCQGSWQKCVIYTRDMNLAKQAGQGVLSCLTDTKLCKNEASEPLFQHVCLACESSFHCVYALRS